MTISSTVHIGQKGRPDHGQLTNVDLLTVDQTARRLGTTARFVRRLVAERRIRYYKVGKYVRFHPDDVADYIRQGRIDPARPVLTYPNGTAAYA